MKFRKLGIGIASLNRVFLFALLFISNISLSISQDCKCNYITDYYPYVYNAEIKYLNNEYDEAYSLLNIAATNCGLLNQPDILESIIFAELSARKQLFNQAFEYLEKVLENGFNYSYLENNPNLKSLQSHPQWGELRENVLKYEKHFDSMVNHTLRRKVIDLIKKDQSLRFVDNKNKEEYKKMKEQDSINFIQIKNIFEMYGYPNTSLIGYSNLDENTDIMFMLMHFNDTLYIKPKLLEFIRKGECSPYVLGYFVDSNDRGKGMFTYGVYQNIDSTKIKDYKSIDIRRESIGLRSYEAEKQKNNLIQDLIEKYRKNKIN